MKKIVLNFFLVSFVVSTASGQIYLNDKNEVIEKKDFINLQQKTGFSFVAENQSQNKLKTIFNRHESGEIPNYLSFREEFYKSFNTTLNEYAPLIIIYYPGKDLCNSSGTSSPKQRKEWYDTMERRSQKIGPSQIMYVYKDDIGLKTKKLIEWKKDRNQLIENTFFKFHYPCSSYSILYKGNYKSFFGEFSKEQVWKDLENILKE